MPTIELETAVSQTHHTQRIAGLDEAGRGALAGPVVAAAVILPLANADALAALADVNDSKQLSARRRETLFELITRHALAFGIGSTSAARIDAVGILPATRLAMVQALSQLTPAPEFLLIDGRLRLRTLPTPQQSVIRGDSLSLSIAAASILAKVTRDRWMINQDAAHPTYGFARHKGYGTAAHRAALSTYGPCPLHRRSFDPLRSTLLNDVP